MLFGKTSLRGLPYDNVKEKIVGFIKKEVGDKKAVIGLSGGIDSSLTAYFSVSSLGKEKVLGLIMPESSSTPYEDIRDALTLASWLGINYRLMYIDGILRSYVSNFDVIDKKALGNLKARIRMSILYYFANINDAIVIGTGDKSEIYLGYFTKYGDGGVDILPIGDVYKTEVRELAVHFNIPETITGKKSSPRLWPGQTAEDELGIAYEVADIILHELIDVKVSEEEIMRKYGESASRVISLMRSSEHKRRMPPIAFLD
ncbi:MAG: NAD+ synthase [Nitrososphaeria archaeon]|nr:NAD+ synthase [Conexivisphaerales archaeon]